MTKANIYLSDGDWVVLIEQGRSGSAAGETTPRDRILNKLESCRRHGGAFFDNHRWIPFHSIVKVEFEDLPDQVKNHQGGGPEAS